LSAITGASVTATVTGTEPRTYTVTGNGCVSTAPADASIEVYPTCYADYYCFNCDFCLDDIKEKINADTIINVANYLKIYPNPNNGTFTLQLLTDSNASTVQIQLFNMLGQMVYRQAATPVNGYLQQQVQPPGIRSDIYVVSVSTGKSVLRKMVIINEQ
jgi:hypothetical protein